MNKSSELLSKLIQNECVNTGELNSGNESKNIDTLETIFSKYSNSIQIERHHKVNGRDNLVDQHLVFCY